MFILFINKLNKNNKYIYNKNNLPNFLINKKRIARRYGMASLINKAMIKKYFF